MYHTMIISTYAIVTGPLQYNAQSPDEAALVSAARNFGYVFLVTATDVMSPCCVNVLFAGSYTLFNNCKDGQQE